MDVTELGEESVTAARRRLRRIEGQVRGLERMLDEDRDCEELLRQIAAASKALRQVGVAIAVDGLERCVAADESDGASGRRADLEQFRKAFLELS